MSKVAGFDCVVLRLQASCCGVVTGHAIRPASNFLPGVLASMYFHGSWRCPGQLPHLPSPIATPFGITFQVPRRVVNYLAGQAQAFGSELAESREGPMRRGRGEQLGTA